MKNQKMYESGDKTVEETCLDNGVDTYTFLAVVNYTINGSGDSGQNVDALSDREKDVIIALVQAPVNNAVRDEAVAALTMLGFSPAPTQKVVVQILQQQPDLPVEQVVKLALKQIK